MGRHSSMWERRCVGWAGVQTSQKTVAEAMVEGPRGWTCDNGILRDSCFGRGVCIEGEYMKWKLGYDSQ